MGVRKALFVYWFLKPKGDALKGIKKKYAWYFLQSKRFRWSWSHQNRGRGRPGFIWGGFRKVWTNVFFDDFGRRRQVVQQFQKSATLVVNWIPGGWVWRGETGCQEGERGWVTENSRFSFQELIVRCVSSIVDCVLSLGFYTPLRRERRPHFAISLCAMLRAQRRPLILVACGSWCWRRFGNCTMSRTVPRQALVIICFLEVLCQFSAEIFPKYLKSEADWVP